MLEKLSSILKKTTDKIANAILLDKTLVDGIIKDLQRALIEADVNVKLVLELSNKLKKIAYDERIKGVEKKEHIHAPRSLWRRKNNNNIKNSSLLCKTWLKSLCNRFRRPSPSSS